jgi:DNA-binding beta-propeller fold protein YncE
VLLHIENQKLTKVAEAPIGHWSQGVAFSSDGKTIVVCNMVEKQLQVLTFDGKTLKDTGKPIVLPGGPVGIRVP